jgi:DNA-binding Lrp family transcriptional regulator
MARPSDATKDQELVNILKANARTPLTNIAKSLGVSRATVQARLSRLEREGLIAGYTIMPGTDSEHLTSISAIVLVELELKQQGHVVAALRKRPEIAQCYTLNGQFDLFVKIRCRTSVHLDEVIDWIGEVDGVRRTTSSVLLSRKFER